MNQPTNKIPTEKTTPTLSLSLSATPPKPTQAQPSEYDSSIAEGSLAQARLFSAISEAEFRRGERSAASWYAIVLTKFAAITDGNASSSLPDPADASSALIDALSTVASTTASSATAAHAQAETAYLTQAASVPDDGSSNAADPGAPAPPQDVTEAWTNDAVHADALKRAYHVLTTTLSSSGLPADKAPQLYIALGDVHWRLRAACSSVGDVAGAVAQARRAERCWEEAEKKAKAVGVQCAEEELEAAGKRAVSVVLRGAGGGGVPLGEAREVALQAVQEMREDELLGDVLAQHALKMLGAA